MYIVYDKKGSIYNAVEDKIEKGNMYLCPLCKREVIYKRCKKIQSHFAHKKNSNCLMNTYKRESKEHLEVKKELYNHFKSKYSQVNLEYIFRVGNKVQIADIYIKEKNLAFEFQKSIIPFNYLKERTLGYKKAGLKVIWLIDIKKFVKELKCFEEIIYIRYAPFVDNFLNYRDGKIFFYGWDIEKNSITLYQIWSCNLKKRNAVAKKIIIPLSNLIIPIKFRLYKDDLMMTISKESIQSYLYNQIKYNKTVKNKILSILYNERISILNIPDEIGFNINEQLLLNSSLVYWQAVMYSKFYNSGGNYTDLLKFMRNIIQFNDSLFLDEKLKNIIFINIINSYYNKLIGRV